MTAHDAKAVQVVEDYVGETRKWPKDSYRVELKRRDGDVLDVSVLYKDDDARKGIYVGGGGKSFAVDVDAKSLRVIRELGFQ